MKFHPIPLIASMLLVYSSFGQVQKNAVEEDAKYRLSLKSGSFIPKKNIAEARINGVNQKAIRSNGKYFVIIQFDTIPGEKEKAQLKQAGVELLDYIPGTAYTATIRGSLSSSLLKQINARAVIELSPEQKMEPSLVDGTFPSWTVKTAGTVDVWINFPASFSFEDVSNELQAKNIDVIATTWKEYRIIGLRIASARLRELASFPFIEYIEPAPKEDEPVNNKSTVNARATILQSSLPGQRNLLGQGITIGIGDDSNPLNHIDFTGRLINRAPIPGGFHGVHVIGTTAGAGIIDERFSGYAPKATIVSQAFSNILAYAPAYVQDFNMVITNNSYGNVVNDCASFGVYDLYSRVMDQQMLRMPNLQHVFAAGNSGGYNCSPYLAGFSNVLGGYQTAKNTISVGNTSELGVIAAGSSKGPVRDGRIKPEISAQGSRVMSTYPGNGYILNSGTSMSSPAVAGGLGLLYQRYKQLHSGNNPRNGLMKALLCNGATDMGNPGPDYSYGFGWMNLLRSVKMIENNNYYTSSVNLNATNTHTVTIPSGIAQLKVMLYWNDSAAAVLASRALVNDLDLQVTGPSATVYYPQLLDTTPVNVNNVATTGPDHINNIEQVVVNNPGAGTYTFSVKGTTIPFASQYEYFLVYDTIPVSATLTYPAGGEHLQATDSIYISWDAYGNTSNDFKIQYSLDNGASWIDINTSVAANLRQLKWFAPSVTTNQAKVKLIHNGTGIESTSAAFTIVGVPAISLSPVQCEGYISLNWPAVAGATDYEVMMLRGDEMVSMGTTVSTMYTISGLSKDSLYFVSVRARVNGSPGRRATAISRQPNNGTCTGTISDNDLKVDAIISPASSGRKFTSTELSNNISITIRLKNLDDVATSGNIPVAYKIGTNPAVNEIITAPNIGAGATYNYTFTVPVDMSSVGSYNLQASVSYPGDPVTTNDTLRKTFKQLDNTVINLTTDFLDNFEAAPEQSFTVLSQMGLEGLDRYDFVTNTIYGRIRSFVNSGIAYSGSKALTLDADRYNAGGTTDSLKGTFNLGSYNANTDDIRLDFMFKHHAQLPNPANKVWIRGDDQKPWILVYDLYANQDDHGVFKKSPSIELGDLLLANSQNFSSSFQVRWGQWGQILTADNDNAAGYTFDDIHLYKAINDIQMVSIDTPIVASCGLQGNVPVRITVRNSANSIISNIPVSFKVDNTATVTETIASIPANTSVTYTFTATTSNLSAEGSHTVKVWADLPSDNYRKNDTATTVLYNSPIISTFPYLQNFESGAGSWFTNGKNSSWEYGTPTSQKINRAANGSKAWKTRLSGSYNDNEMSYLYSPCFNLSGLTNPTLSLSVALDLEDCGSTLCDAAYVEYSVNGLTWTKLGTNGAGTNWYNKNYSGAHLWSVQNYTRWHVATIPLPTGGSRMQLRFVMSSDPYTSFEGIAVDDIHIYDNTMGIYDGVTMVSPVSQPVSGSNWINFTSGGKLIAAVQPNNQNMGATDVQAYINSGAVRTDLNQYYHNRNITIKPAITNLTDSASVRFYFLDTESESLINATGCAGCSKPGTAYELGIPKYGDINDAVENGTIADNTKGIWSFISAAQAVKVPFDKGYYAEFKVKNFSEFWLKKEAFNRVTPPLTQVINFTAAKQSNDVLVQWTVSIAGYADKFEIEVAKGNAQYQLNNFSKIGEATSTGIALQQYQYTDIENNKSGVRYYRLKIINSDGTFFYSEVKAVVFSDELTWQVYPNPSSGIFNLVYQKNEGEPIAIKVYDVYGRMIKQLNFAGNGFVQKSQIDLSNPQFGSGMYMVEVTTAEKKQVFKLLKQ